MTKEMTWIRGGWLIDGTGTPPRRHVLLGIQNGAIACIESAVSGIPDSGEVRSLSDCTLLPGLIDCHVHLFISGVADPVLRESQQHMTFEEAGPYIGQRLKETLSCGVVAVRDGGDAHGHALRYKTGRDGEAPLPVQIRAAGRAWHRNGRYGKFIGRSPSGGETLADGIRSSNHRGDHVKIVNSGINSLRTFGKETPPQFECEELSLAVLAARQIACPTMVHANGGKAVEAAVRSGCDSIEHGFFMGRANLERMAEQRVVWVPTAVTMQAYRRTMESILEDAGEGGSKMSGLQNLETGIGVARRNLDHQLEQVRLAKKLGVVVAAGTDAGSPGVHHGSAVREEIRLLASAGFSIPEAVQCATLNGARLLGLDDCGLISKGMAATLIAAPGSPQDLPESLGRIRALYVRGREYLV